jgi:hypothetical protein
MDFDTAVKLNLYETLAHTGQAPTANQVAAALGAPPGDVLAAFERLHQKRLLVPEPGDPARIRMAPPFSGVETPHRVLAGDRSYYANCIWDALGIPAALHEDARIETSDGHTGEKITLFVKDEAPLPEPCVVHFAVPAALWWKDIIYT